MNEILTVICDKAGIFCERVNDTERMNRVVGFGLGLLETYWLLVNEGGHELLSYCLNYNDCRNEAVNTALSVADMYIRNEYFFTISIEDIRRIISKIKQIKNP
ncbi:hypothetical protein PYJP_11110 [Pyrofollis japonicus]|nr:hypothetical protein PYJP_11110 [Pyrofollis japonicus]